jgi:hypothetical protein
MSAVWLTSFLLPPFASAQQVAPIVPTGPLPTDLTPVRLREERELFKPGPTFYLFQKLPANLWVNVSAETNLRFESNVFLTASHPKADIVYRTFPNITLGYNFLKNTGIYTNYFLIKDVYGGQGTFNHLTIPTNQSLSLGFRHTENWKNTYLQWDFQARELWQAKDLHQFDYIPGFFASRSIARQPPQTPSAHPVSEAFKRKLIGNTTLFTTLQMQLRGGHAFAAPTREIDPFYTLGLFRSWGNWVFSATETFITDFRDPPFRGSVPNHGNVESISDFELYHPLFKHHPSLVGFIRAEPIWNWRSDKAVGLSGFDFRLYSGIRLQASKTALGGTMDTLRKQLKDNEDAPNGQQQQTPPAPGTNPTPTTPVPTMPVIPHADMGAPPPLIIQSAYGPIVIPMPDISAPPAVQAPSNKPAKKRRLWSHEKPAAESTKQTQKSPPPSVVTAPETISAAQATALDGAMTSKEANSASVKLPLRPALTNTQPPALSDTKSPALTDTKSPALTDTKSPALTDTKSPALTDTKSPALTDTKSPALTDTKSPALTDAKSPALTDTKSPALTDAKSPALTDTKSPALTDTKSPALTDTKSPALTDTKTTPAAQANPAATAATALPVI